MPGRKPIPRIFHGVPYAQVEPRSQRNPDTTPAASKPTPAAPAEDPPYPLFGDAFIADLREALTTTP